jgi:transcriptional regulator with XRE-family HTH domain
LRGGKDLKIFERVRKYLDDNGIKHGVIARKAGIPANTFSAIMCGKRTMYAQDYEAICNALNVPADTFFNNRTA